MIISLPGIEERIRRIPRRRIIAAAIALSVFAIILAMPDAARNLLMLAWMRSWTRPEDAALTNLTSAASWLLTNERNDAYLHAQISGIARDLDMEAEASAALERARSLAPIAGQCNSADAMLLEHLARPLLPRAQKPSRLGFTAFSTSRSAISQMRSVAAEDGAAECLYLLTIAAPAGTDDYGAMHAVMPVQPGRRYRVQTECYATGNMTAHFRVSGAETLSVPIDARDAWTTLALEFQSEYENVVQVQIVARAGAGRVTCRDNIISDIT